MMRRRRLESSGATSANWSKLLYENKHRTERQGKKKGRNQRMQKKLNARNILVKVVKNNHSEHWEKGWQLLLCTVSINPYAQWRALPRAAGKLPPLLKSLFLRHPEGEASLVVHAAHHLLPAVVWRLRDDQLITLWKIATKPQACWHERLQSVANLLWWLTVACQTFYCYWSCFCSTKHII